MTDGIAHAIEIAALKALLSGIASPGLQGQQVLLFTGFVAAEAIGRDLINHRLGQTSRWIS